MNSSFLRVCVKYREENTPWKMQILLTKMLRDYYEWLKEREKVKLPKELIITEEGDNLKSKLREVEINSSSKKRPLVQLKSWFYQTK